ncbi:MAG: serine hydrolase domain-containing protein [Planctomycetota bacterium]
MHVADAFAYLGNGQYVHDPDGTRRLFRIGSTSKPVTAVAAKILEERGVLDLDDAVDDADGGLATSGGRPLRALLSHRGCFTTDFGALRLYCYPGDLPAFWAEADDAVSPRYDSSTWGNLGGGYSYSAFNYSLAGAHLVRRSGMVFRDLLQGCVFDPAGMCTASTDGDRARGTLIGEHWSVSQAAVMDVGPTINLVAPTDPHREDDFTSSDDVPGDPYTFQVYRLDEADSRARDPAGGVLASALDMALFARELLASYRAPGGLLSQDGVRELWWATTDLGCGGSCPYERYYGIGFFTDTLPGEPVRQIGHGGSRPGYASAFVLRPEANRAVCILANADVSTVRLSDVAKAILDDFE